MSRIAGVYQKEGTKSAESIVCGMLEAIKSSNQGSVKTRASDHFSVGLLGWQESKIIKKADIILAIDGHIYNENELEADLITLYQKYGFEETIKRLNGDFAIVLYDLSINTLWLARDRLGIKPLYFVNKSNFFAFSSRLKSLLSLSGVSRKPRNEFVALFAGSHYRYFDNAKDKSPFEEIFQLPAAYILRYKNGELKTTCYWQMRDEPDWDISLDELAERYRYLLMDAVSCRLKVAKSSAFTLSGGMDSSSVMALAVQSSGSKQHAFSTVYPDRTYDESEEIKSMLDKCVGQWHQVAVDQPPIMELIQEMIGVHDEPVATATWLSHFLLCKQAKQQGFRSLFGGLGGDELNAGEYEHFIFFFADLRLANNETRLKEEVKMWIKYHNHPVYKKSFALVEDSFKKLVDFRIPGKCLPDRARISKYAKAINYDYFDFDTFNPVMDQPFKSYLKNRTYQDMMRETIPCCLRAEDRQGAAFGLDNFLPFFDYRLVEFMFKVSANLKYDQGVTKHLLRQAMKGVLPEETRARVQKTGWNAPAHIWFSGKGRNDLRDIIESQAFRNRGIYNVKEVNRLLDEHQQIVSSGVLEENHMMFFWQLVNLELWLQTIDASYTVSEVRG
ncbi:MAG: asparagine synthase-related protein [Candidatus Omnitrophota bacterium]